MQVVTWQPLEGYKLWDEPSPRRIWTILRSKDEEGRCCVSFWHAMPHPYKHICGWSLKGNMEGSEHNMSFVSEGHILLHGMNSFWIFVVDYSMFVSTWWDPFMHQRICLEIVEEFEVRMTRAIQPCLLLEALDGRYADIDNEGARYWFSNALFVPSIIRANGNNT